MMEARELERRRGWPWKNRKHHLLGLSSGSDGSSSPPPPSVKLFDEQEVARILQDQVRIGDEQMLEALHVADMRHAEKEKAWSAKLATVNSKLSSALAEIVIKDDLVKQHIKVAEEAVVGWEKAESEAAEFKADLESVTKQRIEAEGRAKHLDGALNEIMQQLRGGREEQEKLLHDTIVKKTREFDKLRLEMEAKLSEASKSLTDNRTQLIESQAENEALNHALKDRSRMIAELDDVRAHVETDSKILRVRLEGLEKENFELKYKVHSMTKELEIRAAELEYGKKTSDVLSRHHAESVKKIVRLEDECNRLRVMVRKKLPNPAAIVRMKQELDALGKEAGDSGRPTRRRPLIRSQSGGVDFLPFHDLAHEDPREAADALQRLANIDEETRMLKEALAKRNDELQQARIMCAKTASRLTAVEHELHTLRAGVSSETISHNNNNNNDASSSCASMSHDNDASSSSAPSKDGSVDGLHKLGSRLGSNGAQETATVNGSDMVESQQQTADGLEISALAAKTRDLEVANQMCEELSVKLTDAENQFAALQSRNAANEQSVIMLQERLDKLLESQEEADAQIPEAEINMELQMELATAVKTLFQTIEALARAVEIVSSPAALEDATTGSIAKSCHWQNLQLESSMSSLVLAANNLLEGQAHPVSFVSELSSTLTCITAICTVVRKDVQKDHEAVCMHLESAKTQISQLEQALHKLQEERAEAEKQTQAELDRVFGLEKEIEQLEKEKAEIVHHVSVVEPQLREANARVDALQEQVKEAESLVAALRLQQDQQKQEDELLEQELLELSSSHNTMRGAEAEMNELHGKLAALENELHGERRRHHDVVAKLEDLQEQIHRGVGRTTDAARVHSKALSQPFIGADEASRSARQEREISAAALAECQRTILALGKQLKILGFSESHQLTLNATTDSPDSIKRMTETMELLRWQTESGDQGPPQKTSSLVTGSDYSWDEVRCVTAPSECSTLPSLYYRQSSSTAALESITDGPVSVPASPSARSDLEAPSTPESPVIVRRSVRTVRPFQLPKARNSITEVTPITVDPRTGATYSRFFARSFSEASISSGHSNGNS